MAPPVTSSGGGTGFVAVLASVPHSASSRIDALKRFADMQQKYSTALSGKTPDIATANLGAKGSFDRLVVGPPGSRQEANNVCTQLKAQGYSSCWGPHSLHQIRCMIRETLGGRALDVPAVLTSGPEGGRDTTPRAVALRREALRT